MGQNFIHEIDFAETAQALARVGKGILYHSGSLVLYAVRSIIVSGLSFKGALEEDGAVRSWHGLALA